MEAGELVFSDWLALIAGTVLATVVFIFLFHFLKKSPHSLPFRFAWRVIVDVVGPARAKLMLLLPVAAIAATFFLVGERLPVPVVVLFCLTVSACVALYLLSSRIFPEELKD